MLNFKIVNIILIILLLLIAGINMRFYVPWYAYAIILLLYSLVLFYGSYYIGSNFFMKVLCRANTTTKQIAISFDDGPAQAHTAEILDVLKSNNVPAVFFCIGKNITGNEYLLKKIAADGHIIGNHSYSHHFWFDLFSTKKMREDLELMNEQVKKITGFTPLLFRPPYGVTTPNMKKVMQQTGLTAVGWNVRSLDTVINDKETLLKKITGLLQPGAIILLHDTSSTTLSILPSFIAGSRKQGYEFVRLDHLLNITPYA